MVQRRLVGWLSMQSRESCGALTLVRFAPTDKLASLGIRGLPAHPPIDEPPWKSCVRHPVQRLRASRIGFIFCLKGGTSSADRADVIQWVSVE